MVVLLGLVAHHGNVVEGFCVDVVHHGVVVPLVVVSGRLVLGVVVHSHVGVVLLLEEAPLSTPVVSTGAAGVIGSGGLLQSLICGTEMRPNPRFIALRRGKVPSQQRLL